jgi:hypothetical protein
MGEDGLDKGKLALVVNIDDEAVAIALDIEDSKVAHSFGRGEDSLYGGKAAPLGFAGNSIPVEERLGSIGVLGAELNQNGAADNVQRTMFLIEFMLSF